MVNYVNIYFGSGVTEQRDKEALFSTVSQLLLFFKIRADLPKYCVSRLESLTGSWEIFYLWFGDHAASQLTVLQV